MLEACQIFGQQGQAFSDGFYQHIVSPLCVVQCLEKLKAGGKSCTYGNALVVGHDVQEVAEIFQRSTSRNTAELVQMIRIIPMGCILAPRSNWRQPRIVDTVARVATLVRKCVNSCRVTDGTDRM